VLYLLGVSRDDVQDAEERDLDAGRQPGGTTEPPLGVQ
jgi:hypothetical protein